MFSIHICKLFADCSLMSLFHNPHLIVTFFHTLLLFQPFSASSSLTRVTVFFLSPFYSLPFTLQILFLLSIYSSSPLSCLFSRYYLPLCPLPPNPSFLYPPFPPLVMPIFPSKNTKSRGSKHKSRRKPKKQKRPPSVCNSLT